MLSTLLYRFGFMLITICIVFVSIYRVLKKREVIEKIHDAYAGEDKIMNSTEANSAFSNLIQGVSMGVMVVMVVITYVDNFEFGEWKWIMAFTVWGAQMEKISGTLPIIIQAFRKKSI